VDFGDGFVSLVFGKLKRDEICLAPGDELSGSGIPVR
jgi:hypothetical protein